MCTLSRTHFYFYFTCIESICMKSGEDLFKDRKQRIIGIPLVALLLTILLIDGENVSFPLGFLIGLTYTFTIWESNRMVFFYFNKRYAAPEQTLQRVVLQSTVSLVVTTGIASCMLILEVYVFQTCSLDTESFSEKVWHSLIPTAIITILYEARVYYNRWKYAIEEGERLKRENISIQLQGLKNQISPHFLFNSLNTLAAIIPEDPAQSVEFVHKLSHTYRYLLEQKDKTLVELATELDFILSYYFLQRIRFGENLQLHIDLPEDCLSRKLPPLSLQLLIENAIKHNVISSQKPLTLRICMDNAGRLVVQNNIQPRLMVEPSTGIGLHNIESRYRHLEVTGMEVKQDKTQFSVYLPLLV